MREVWSTYAGQFLGFRDQCIDFFSVVFLLFLDISHVVVSSIVNGLSEWGKLRFISLLVRLTRRVVLMGACDDIHMARDRFRQLSRFERTRLECENACIIEDNFSRISVILYTPGDQHRKYIVVSI